MERKLKELKKRAEWLVCPHKAHQDFTSNQLWNQSTCFNEDGAWNNFDIWVAVCERSICSACFGAVNFAMTR